MLIEKHLLSELKPASYNPRVDLKPSDKEYQAIKNSIESFGNIEPIVWNKRTGNIVGGHQRYKILKEQGITETEVVVVDFDEDKEKAANLALNKAVGLWDDEAVNKLLEELKNTEWDMSDFNFDIPNISINEEVKNNSPIELTSIKAPIYEMKGEEPKISELCNQDKTNELIQEIQNSNCSDEIKQFLILASYRFLDYRFDKIAEYYAHADKEVQDLMEKSALVIIDFNKAIEYGFVELQNTIEAECE